MASSEGSHGRNNETVFNVIDSDKDSLKEAHEALNQLREKIRGREQDLRDAKDVVRDSNSSIHLMKDAYVKQDCGTSLLAVKVAATDSLCKRLGQEAENKAAETRKARRFWSSMADTNLEKNVEFAINWNCTQQGQQLRRKQFEDIVEDTKTEKDTLEEDLAQFLETEEAYFVDAQKLSGLQALASKESEEMSAEENVLEVELAALLKHVESYEAEHEQILETLRIKRSRLTETIQTKSAYLARLLTYNPPRCMKTGYRPRFNDQKNRMGQNKYPYSRPVDQVHPVPALAHNSLSTVPSYLRIQGYCGNNMTSTSSGRSAAHLKQTPSFDKGSGGVAAVKDPSTHFRSPQERPPQRPMVTSSHNSIEGASSAAGAAPTSNINRSIANNVRKRFNFKKILKTGPPVAQVDNVTTALDLTQRKP